MIKHYRIQRVVVSNVFLLFRLIFKKFIGLKPYTYITPVCYAILLKLKTFPQELSFFSIILHYALKRDSLAVLEMPCL